MNRTLGAVKTVVRSIIGDPDGDWADDAYLNPMVNHCYNLQITYLSRTCNPFMTALKFVLALPAGTTDLTDPITAANGQLYGLRNPLRVDWKQAGQPVSCYREARRTAVLADLNGQAPGFCGWLQWEWRSKIIYLTPMTYPIDIRVRGEYTPPPLLKDEDAITVHDTLGDVLAEETAACAMRERGNAGQMQAYQLIYTTSLDDIARELVNDEQSLPVRMGRASGRRRRF